MYDSDLSTEEWALIKHHFKPKDNRGAEPRDLEIIKIRELRRIFGCSFRCNAGRIVSYVTGITTETTAKKTSKTCNLIFSKSPIHAKQDLVMLLGKLP